MVNKLGLNRLRNAELIQYFTLLLALIDAAGRLPAALTDSIAALRAVLGELEALHKTDPASHITDELLERDGIRDDLYTGLLAHCRNFSHHNDPALKAAGALLDHILGVYGTAKEVTQQPYGAETTDIDSVLADLARPEAAAALAQTGATMWSVALKTANDRFKERFLDRTGENAAKEFAFTMKQKRNESAAAYGTFVRRLSAACELESTSELEQLAAKMNALTTEYRQLLATRAGRAEARNEAVTPGA